MLSKNGQCLKVRKLRPAKLQVAVENLLEKFDQFFQKNCQNYVNTRPWPELFLGVGGCLMILYVNNNCK